MTLVLYDGSFAGLLSAVFEIYEYNITEPSISRSEAPTGSLFGTLHSVVTNTEKSARVYKRLKDRLTPNALKQLHDAFLSELKDVENVLLRYVRYALNSPGSVENNYANADVLFVQQTSRKVHREKHRMEAFVRFRLTRDELYYAIIQPDYNVLPLISKHFKERYADQRWLIYDALRKYGLYYDGEKVEEVQVCFNAGLNSEQGRITVYDEQEELYQDLWKQYFSSVNIKARKNTKLHIQHMPKRYWKYLVEKQ